MFHYSIARYASLRDGAETFVRRNLHEQAPLYALGTTALSLGDKIAKYPAKHVGLEGDNVLGFGFRVSERSDEVGAEELEHAGEATSSKKERGLRKRNMTMKD